MRISDRRWFNVSMGEGLSTLVLSETDLRQGCRHTYPPLTQKSDHAKTLLTLLNCILISQWRLILSSYNILVKGSRNPLLQEHDSVMFGEISPHHEYYDSKSSTETPPSYNQLNYNENLERFFKSKPLVTIMYSDEENVNSSNDEGGKSSSSIFPRPCIIKLFLTAQ